MLYRVFLVIFINSVISIICGQLAWAYEYTINSTYLKYIKKYPNISQPDLVVPTNIKMTTDRVYRSINGLSLSLDLYQRDTLAKEKSTLIILIHGGGWQVGDKSLMQPLALGLAQKGYTVVAPNYRMSNQAKFPAAVNDLSHALLWLKNNNERLALNTESIVLAGTSAGGQLAALLAYSQGKLLFQSAPDFKMPTINKLINIDGLSDFTSAQALPFENNPTKKVTAASRWLGGRYEDVPSTWQAASPIYYISEKSPDTLFINSSVTRFSAGRDAAINKLTQFGVQSKVVLIDNSPHSFWLLNPWIKPTVKNMDIFIKNSEIL